MITHKKWFEDLEDLEDKAEQLVTHGYKQDKQGFCGSK